MNIKSLFSLLTHVGYVRSTRWDDVCKIVELMPSIKVQKKKWFDKFRQNNPDIYPLDLTKLDTWSTSEANCIDLVFKNDNNKLICDVKIYDGNFFDGYREKLRFTAKLVMPNKYIKKLEKKILYGLDSLAEEEYNNHLKNQKKLWVSNFKAALLNSVA